MISIYNNVRPFYYDQFLQQIEDGLPVCKEILLECRRIEMLVADPQYYYDPDVVEGFIEYCENELTLTDGSDMTLTFPFKLWAEQALGWYYFEEIDQIIRCKDGSIKTVRKNVPLRLIHKQYLIVARGAAKSMYASVMQSYFLNIEPRSTQQIATAYTMKQAEEVVSPIKTSITRARGPLFQFLCTGTGNTSQRYGDLTDQVKLYANKHGVRNRVTNSYLEIRNMSVDRLQGSRATVITIDEWLSGDVKEDIIGAVEQGASKSREYLILAISSEGIIRNKIGDSIKMELYQMLNGEYINPHVSIWYYKLDDISEVNDPSMWVKANPNIGVTVSYDAYNLDVERLEKVPSTRNDILAKRFGLPMAGFTYFFSYEETLPFEKGYQKEMMPCSLGIDLSQGDDFTAFTFLFPRPNGQFEAWTRCYVTKIHYDRLPLAMQIKYDEFYQEGSLCIVDATILDMMWVYDDINAIIDTNQFDVCSVGFDPYNAQEFIQRWSVENGSFGLVKVAQGVRTESVPLGELKILFQQRGIIFTQQLMSFALGNCVTMEDTNGNRKLLKRRADEKIDAVSALLDAWVAYKLNKDNF